MSSDVQAISKHAARSRATRSVVAVIMILAISQMASLVQMFPANGVSLIRNTANRIDSATGLNSEGLFTEPQADAAANEQVVVVAPVSGRVTSQPTDTGHYLGGDDWSTDIGANGGVAVRARFANATGRLNLKVEAVFESCRAPNRGGQAVRLEVKVDGSRLGTVSYLHLSGVPVRPGQTISNGTKIGVLASSLPRNESCWTGSHVHMGVRNDRSYACFIRRTTVNSSTQLGVLGGSHVSGVRQSCPGGATTASSATNVYTSRYIVYRTAGHGLNVRSQPTTRSTRVGHVRDNQQLAIICQVRDGQNVWVDQQPGPNFHWRVWNKVKLPNGSIGFAHDGWTNVPANGGGIPRC